MPYSVYRLIVFVTILCLSHIGFVALLSVSHFGFVTYRVCRLIVFVAYIGFVTFLCLSLIGFVTYTVCRLIVFVTFRVCCLKGLLPYRFVAVPKINVARRTP